MGSALKGRVQGKTIVLDESIPPLDGRRVLVVVEPADEPELDKERSLDAPELDKERSLDAPELDKARSLDAWNAWVAKGPQGPIADDDEPSFP